MGLDGRNSVDEYYAYAKKIVSKVINKVSIQKMREVWLGPYHNLKEEQKTGRKTLIDHYHEVMRCLSRYYL